LITQHCPLYNSSVQLTTYHQVHSPITQHLLLLLYWLHKCSGAKRRHWVWHGMLLYV